MRNRVANVLFLVSDILDAFANALWDDARSSASGPHDHWSRRCRPGCPAYGAPHQLAVPGDRVITEWGVRYTDGTSASGLAVHVIGEEQ